MRRVFANYAVKAIPWAVLGVAFVLFGVWLRMQMPQPIGCGVDTELYSFDFLGYADLFSDYRYFSYGRFRHPLWGWLTVPVPLLGQRFLDLGQWYFWGYLLVIFSSVMLGCVCLLKRLLTRYLGLAVFETFVCLALFLSFAQVWILAGIPETFGVSMLLALVTLNWASGCERLRELETVTVLGETFAGPRLGARLEFAGWIVLAVITGGVTLTQAAKTAVAYSFSGSDVRRRLIRTLLLFAGAGLLVTLVFYIRMRVRVWRNPEASGWNDAWDTLFGNIAPVSMPLSERLRYIWVFFSEPLILRGESFSCRMLSGGYSSILQPLVLSVLYSLVAVSVWINRRYRLVRIILVMFTIDVAIHMVVGWGLAESQLYGGHWMYVLPVLVGLLLGSMKGKSRRLCSYTVLLLAFLCVICNIRGFLSGAGGGV